MTSTFHHVEVLGQQPVELSGDRRPQPGPIAVIPAKRDRSDFIEAIIAGGGTVGEVDAQTRGLVYTSYSDVDTLVSTLETHPDIGWVQLPFAGIDAYAARLIPFAERGVLFTAAKGSYSQPVAEHALTLTLALLRVLPRRIRATSWGKSDGRSLFGLHVVIVGGGGIARELIRLLQPFGVRTTVVRRSAAEVPEADQTLTHDRLGEVLPEADVLVLAAPATPDTRGMISAPELAAMKPTAVLVNIGRGPLIDTDALVAALDAEEIYGAGLDVTSPEPLPAGHPLYSHERAIITPHTADTPAVVRPLLLSRVHENVRGFTQTGVFTGVADPQLGY